MSEAKMPYKCSFTHCVCALGEPKSFCSDWCRENVANKFMKCQCGHAICEEINRGKV